jgi:hypothetical protein
VTGGAGVFVWAAFLAGTLGTTAIGRSGGNDASLNFNLAQSDGYAFAKHGSGLTSLPGTIALSGTAKELGYWAAVA